MKSYGYLLIVIFITACLKPNYVFKHVNSIEYETEFLEIREESCESRDRSFIKGVFYMGVKLSSVYMGGEKTYDFVSTDEVNDEVVQYSYFVFDSLGNVIYNTYALDKFEPPLLRPHIPAYLLISELESELFKDALQGRYFKFDKDIYMLLEHRSRDKYIYIIGELGDCENNSVNCQEVKVIEVDQPRKNYSPLRKLSENQDERRRTYNVDSVLAIEMKFIKVDGDFCIRPLK